ncbi:MAG: hypothetical protein V1766_15570 [Pseudomonadota bacterium]
MNWECGLDKENTEIISGYLMIAGWKVQFAERDFSGDRVYELLPELFN